MMLNVASFLPACIIAGQSKWKESFNRLFTTIRGVLWNHFILISVLECCGAAGGLPPCMQA